MLLAVELANDPPTDLEDLLGRCEDHDVLVDRAAPADFAACRDLIDAWLTVVDADDPGLRAERLNSLLAHNVSFPRVTDHAGSGWHIHYRDSDTTLAGQLAVLILVGTALHLTTRGMSRLARCSSTDCRLVFADVSRNGTQRYCSPRCGSREAVRRHRAG